MRVGLSRLHHPVTALGFGTRVGVWFQGCSIRCAGCVSRDTWETSQPAGTVEVADVVDAIAAVGPVDGLTVSGGEPFDQPLALGDLIRGFRRISAPDADVLVYSGYSTARILRRHGAVALLADALITGPYRPGRPGDALRGSSNQEVLAFSELGRKRYGEGADSCGALQVAAVGGQVWMIGIPAPGDMERLKLRLEARGVRLGDVSWQC